MPTTMNQVQESLRKLDHDYYDNLLIKEKALMDALDRLQKDETHLRQAIAAHETIGSAPPPPPRTDGTTTTTSAVHQRKMLQAQAEARLQEALFAASSDEESHHETTT